MWTITYTPHTTLTHTSHSHRMISSNRFFFFSFFVAEELNVSNSNFYFLYWLCRWHWNRKNENGYRNKIKRKKQTRNMRIKQNEIFPKLIKTTFWKRMWTNKSTKLWMKSFVAVIEFEMDYYFCLLWMTPNQCHLCVSNSIQIFL